MKVDLPIEQWNALGEAAKRNIELLQLALMNVDMVAKAQAEAERKAAERAAKRKKSDSTS